MEKIYLNIFEKYIFDFEIRINFEFDESGGGGRWSNIEFNWKYNLRHPIRYTLMRYKLLELLEHWLVYIRSLCYKLWAFCEKLRSNFWQSFYSHSNQIKKKFQKSEKFFHEQLFRLKKWKNRHQTHQELRKNSIIFQISSPCDKKNMYLPSQAVNANAFIINFRPTLQRRQIFVITIIDLYIVCVPRVFCVYLQI